MNLEDTFVLLSLDKTLPGSSLSKYTPSDLYCFNRFEPSHNNPIGTFLSACCDRKAQATSAKSFTLWQQTTIKITCHDHSIIACSRHIYMGVILCAHPVHGESHIQRNVNREAATHPWHKVCTMSKMRHLQKFSKTKNKDPWKLSCIQFTL